MSEDKALDRIFVRYSDYLLLENSLSELSIKAYTSDVRIFIRYLKGLDKSSDGVHFSKEDVLSYLADENKKEASSELRFLCSLRSYSRFLIKEGLIDSDPLVHIDNPKQIKSIPESMSEKCVESFLNAPDVNCHTGCRDKAMLETVYATGLRISELISLKFDNINFSDGFIVVRGKGDKERLVPIGESALYYLEYYISTFRKEKDPKRKCPYIFLSGKGLNAMTRIAFWYRIKVYSKALGITQNVTPHSFRHAFATHLLNHDADLRSVQMLLGHSSLTTTQIYTHVATYRMHQVYDRAHPRASKDDL